MSNIATCDLLGLSPSEDRCPFISSLSTTFANAMTSARIRVRRERLQCMFAENPMSSLCRRWLTGRGRIAQSMSTTARVFLPKRKSVVLLGRFWTMNSVIERTEMRSIPEIVSFGKYGGPLSQSTIHCQRGSGRDSPQKLQELDVVM